MGHVGEQWRQAEQVLDDLVKTRAWEAIPPGRPYGTLDALLRAETGLDEQEFRQRITGASATARWKPGDAPLTPECVSQLRVTPAAHEGYARAAALLWGQAGEFAAAEFARLNREHFAGSIPPLPIVVGLTAFGHCVGLTRHRGGSWLDSPRISLAPEVFRGSGRTRGGPRQVSDVLVHEMVHVALFLRGEDPAHNAPPWCELITALSLEVLGREITARPVRTHRVPNPARESDPDAPKTIVRRMPEPGALAQRDLARWPHSLRPGGWYGSDRPIHVPTY